MALAGGRSGGGSHGGGKGQGRGKGPGRGGDRGVFAGGLYQPSQVLTGKPLAKAAQQIANAQTKGPLAELARQRAQGIRQGAAAQQKTFGYYMQLAQDAQNSLNQTQQVGQALNSQLQGIQGQQQAALNQYGQQATGGALSRLAAMGLDAGQTQALQADAARQQATGAQNAAAFQSAGATQGANYSGLAASNLGTYALRGQERIGDIGRATQLSLEPLRAKQAGLLASKGALKATALGQLRTQGQNFLIAQQGLGLKKDTITAENKRAAASLRAAKQRNQATITAEGQRNTDSINARIKVAKIDAKLAGGRLTEQKRHDLIGERQGWQRIIQAGKKKGPGSGSGGGGSPMTTHEQNQVYNEIDTLQGKIKNARAAGYTGAEIRQMLQSGFDSKANNGKGVSIPSYPSQLIEAAYELLGWGQILPKTAKELHQMGLRGGRYTVRRGDVAGATGISGLLKGISGALG